MERRERARLSCFIIAVALLLQFCHAQTCNSATTCSNHGVCQGQSCVCDPGFTGLNCSICSESGAPNTYPRCFVTNGANNHKYTLVRNNNQYQDAWNNAKNMIPYSNGVIGTYLATITDVSEMNFIKNLFPNGGFWVGGADYNGQGTWSWMGGPDKPLVFYQVDDKCITYCNWGNNTGPTVRQQRGLWVGPNNLWVSQPYTGYNSFYLVEYGGQAPPTKTDVIFNPDNFHYYKLVRRNLNWNDANNAANSDRFQGTPGYLVTVTTAREHNFLFNNYGFVYTWLGASDTSIEGTWKWGKDNITFYLNGYCVGFCIWNIGEPNNVGGEDAMAWRINDQGQIGDWNDLPTGTNEPPYYVVEFDCNRAQTCNNHGSCSVTGKCICDPGYTGDFCRGCGAGSNATDCYIMNPSNGHGYKLVQNKVEFQTALTSAASAAAGGYLATITDASERAFIQTNFAGYNYWIAGTDYRGQGSWSWVAGPEKPLVFYQGSRCVDGMYCAFTQDTPKPPSPLAIQVEGGSGNWIPTEFTGVALYYLIETGGTNFALTQTAVWNPANSHFYRYVTGQYNWRDAVTRSYADRYLNTPGYLVTVTTPEEHNFLAKSFGPISSWIGASDMETEGTFKWWTKENTTFWSNGQCTGFCMWNTGEPNDAGGNEDGVEWIVAFNDGDYGDWNDNNINNLSPAAYIVEYDCARDTTCGGRGDCKPDGTCTCDVGFSGPYCTNCTQGGTYPFCWIMAGNGHGYMLFRTNVDFLTAWSRACNGNCGTQGGPYLATITSQDEANFIQNTFTPSQSYWIGGADYNSQGVFNWISGPEKPLAFFWNGAAVSGQYNNFQPAPTGRSTRGVLVSASGTWSGAAQTTQAWFLAEVGGTRPIRNTGVVYNQANNHFYKVVPQQGITWTDANNNANNDYFQDTRGYLATVTSPQEHNFLYQSFGILYVWIGGSDTETEGVWKWGKENVAFWQNGACVDGAFCLWNNGEPNNVNNEDALVWDINPTNRGDWNDLGVGDRGVREYIVEYECARETTCANHGSCITSGTLAGTCQCDAGYTGSFCRGCDSTRTRSDCFIMDPISNHGYQLVSTATDWRSAWNAARNNFGVGSYLVSITSALETNFLRTTFPGITFWAGGADANNQGPWNWVTGPDKPIVFWFNGSCVIDQYCNFGGTPPLGGSAQGLLVDGSGAWIPTNTTASYPYILEIGGSVPTPLNVEAVYNPDNNHFYKLQWSQGTTWDNARINAINNVFQGTNGYMATITTPQEHNFLYTSFGYMYTWLGASDLENEGTWKWVTKENTTFFQGGRCVGFCLWNLGEPNNVGDEDALVWDLYQGNVGDWNDQARGNNGVWQTLIEFDCGRDTTCGGHGDCTAAGICKCDPGYGGDFCRTCTGGAGTWPTCFLVNPVDGHGYFYINGSWDYLTAWNRAFSSHGSGAYLATITSQTEQNFIMSHFAAANFWVAGADWDGQGTWAWTAGPENSMVFYHTSTGCLTTMYCNWRANPPLDRNPSKGILIDSRGNWVPTNFTSGRGGYLVEIGGIVPQRTKDIIFNPTNMHFYKFVSNYLTWDQALATAAQDNFMDTPGYLLTVTDPYENNFLFQNFGYLYSHIGGSDKDVEGTWRWTSNGNQIFWTGGQCTSFCMWGLGEPNDQGPQNEDIMTWIVEANRINYWNDLRADVLSPPVYVVEFDCTREHTCGGHGVCNTAGTCTCDQGYSGDFCRSCATSTNTQGCFVTNPANGHSYMLVSTNMEFQAAWSAAARNYGSSAYLATITDSTEMNFIRTTFAGKSFWVSGADYRGQGTWQWLAGPDKPLVFWTVQSSCTTGMFCGWTNGPTTRTPGALMIDASGNWVNQAFTGFRTNYLVEMGGAFPNNTGIAYNSANNHFYRFVNQGVSWNQAMTASAVSTFQDTPGYLVTVTTPQEFNFLYTAFGTFYSHIGASDRVTEGTWVWESNPAEVTSIGAFWINNACRTFCVWGLGEPNEAGGEDGSTWIIEQNRMNDWNDLSVDGGAGSYIIEYECTRTTCGGHGVCTPAGICQCDPGYSGDFCRTCADNTANSGCAIAFNGHQYRLVSSPLSFQAALNAANQVGGGWYLATITSQAESDFIRTTYAGGNFWIGAADYRGQGSWSWISGPEKPTVFYHVQYTCVENQFCGTFSTLSTPTRAVQAVMLDANHNWIPQPWTGVSASGGYLLELGGSYPVPTYDVVFNPANKHFYQIFDARISWDLARQQANENAFMGTPGYLATIGTPQEHNFLYSKFGNLYGWIGGSDSAVEGTWRWVTGDNSIFWQNGQCVSFCMFNVGEPNNVNDEDVLVWTVDPNTMGDWNDLRPNDLGSNVRQYLVEYDCDRFTTCGGHGDCNTDGKCTCDNGFTGDFCRACSSAGTYPGCFITDTATNHSYMIIQGNWRWQDAWNDATNSKYGNAYFASITSDAERDFVTRTFPGLSYWISGADFRGQGSWGWTAGPEKGIQFYHVDTGRLTGVPGAYANFAGGTEPTDRTARAVLVDASGTWIPSFTANVTSNYLLEFGGSPPVSKGSIQYNAGNQHWYQLVTSSVSWDASVTLAANTKYWDASGYLVTVTDAHEQNFLSYNFGSFFTQLGASDKDTEGVWRWSTRENTILWQGGQCVGFCLWGNGEPNDANIGEDAVNWRNQHNTIQNEWNDFPSNEIQATHYIVEFECSRETMCGGHGNCNGERCQCDSGYSGQFCRGCAPGSSATDCFTMDPSTEHGYRLIRGNFDFQSALAQAQSQYGSEAYLATITSQAENDFIRKTFGGASFWTSGADYNGQGSWSWGAGPEKPIVFYHVTDKCVAGEYCNWGSSPNNREQRALVVDGSGTWSAQPLSSTNNYLVEIGGRAPEIANPLQFNPANFHFYQYVTDVRSWYLALVTAAATQYQGTPGYLVTVNSAAEHNFLYRKFGRVNTWLGGSNQLDRGTWLWDAKENSTFFSGGKCNSFCLFADGYPTGASTDSVTGLAWTIDNTYNGWDIKKASNITLAPPGYIIEYECARTTTCGGHGDCTYQGICSCDGGWTGDFCRSCSNVNETYPFCTGVPGSTTAAIQGGGSGGLSSGAIAAIVVVVVVVVLVAVALVLLKMRGVLQLQRFNRFHDKPGGGSLGSQGATAE